MKLTKRELHDRRFNKRILKFQSIFKKKLAIHKQKRIIPFFFWASLFKMGERQGFTHVYEK